MRKIGDIMAVKAVKAVFRAVALTVFDMAQITIGIIIAALRALFGGAVSCVSFCHLIRMVTL